MNIYTMLLMGFLAIVMLIVWNLGYGSGLRESERRRVIRHQRTL